MFKKFIKTSDKETRDKLIKLGFYMVNESGGCYTFINSKNLKFSEDVSKMVAYTNVLTL